MHRFPVHSKATVISRNPPDSKYLLWEEKQYPSSKYPSERREHVPSEEKIAYYHEVDSHLRRRLHEAGRAPDSEKKQQRLLFLHKLLDANMGRVFHERDPKNNPDLQEWKIFGNAPAKPEEKRQPVLQKPALLVMAEKEIPILRMRFPLHEEALQLVGATG